eukprot:5623-Pelagomonas_calceolata.AAC.5
MASKRPHLVRIWPSRDKDARPVCTSQSACCEPIRHQCMHRALLVALPQPFLISTVTDVNSLVGQTNIKADAVIQQKSTKQQTSGLFCLPAATRNIF